MSMLDDAGRENRAIPSGEQMLAGFQVDPCCADTSEGPFDRSKERRWASGD